MQTILFKDLGMIDYQTAWNLQELLLKENALRKSATKTGIGPEALIAEEETTHHLLFVEHPPVYTLGKSGLMEHVLVTMPQLQKTGIEFFKTNRGGDITFHGPGQLVGYPILDLEKFYRDIGRYLRNLEEVVIRVMADFGLQGERSKGETGVWIDPLVPGKQRKICAIGVRCSRWITMHGFALNVNTDLDYFNQIIPCGIPDKQVTSLKKELGREVSMDVVKKRLVGHFGDVFESEIIHASQQPIEL